MSSTLMHTLEPVAALIQKFDLYTDLFLPHFLQYNGEARTVSIQYRVRTFQNLMDEGEFLKNLIVQYVQNPIQIPSSMYHVRIYDQKSTVNLGLDERYLIQSGEFVIIDLSELCNRDSEYITIIIDSNFQIDAESLVAIHISKQPKVLQDETLVYEVIGALKPNKFPEAFQLLNIPVSIELELNGFLDYFIERRFLDAAQKWYNMERLEKGDFRKKRVYEQMIKNRYKITPLEFNKRISIILHDFIDHVQKKYPEIVKITTSAGIIEPELPRGYNLFGKNDVKGIIFHFTINFDSNNIGIQANLFFKTKWMKNIIDRHLPKKINSI